MKLKQTILIFALLIGLGGFFVSPTASAVVCGTVTLGPGQSCCDGVVTSVLSCKNPNDPNPIVNTGIWQLLLFALNIMTAGVGIAGVGGILYGSILYTTASGNMEQVKKSRHIIANTVVGLILYAAMYSLMNFMIPGGVFS